MKKQIVLLVILLLMLMAIAGYVLYGQWQLDHEKPYYSDVAEATSASLAFQAPGKVIAILM